MDDLLRTLKALGEETRARIARLLLLERALNVGELTRILGIPQSSVSRALGDLKRMERVRERREGGFVYHEWIPGTGAFAAIETLLREAGDEEGDRSRLAEVLREREEHGRGAAAPLEPGRSWVAWARALRFLVPPLRVADLGCGDGALTAEIARFARSVVGVEQDRTRLAAARERMRSLGLRNVKFLREDATATSLGARSQDLVVLSQLLHHLDQPAAALAEAARLLVPGGRALVLELGPHDERWVKEKLGHRHLGFSPQALEKLLEGSGLREAVIDPVAARGVREPFRVLVASAVKA